MKELLQIQQWIRMKKERHNEFQKFDYWNLEDVLNTVRPKLAELNCTLTFSDTPAGLGTRFGISATATLTNVDTGQSVSCTAFAEISAEKENGMSKPQMSGTASSYARKYAVNGLFALNDMRDADEIEQADMANGKRPRRKPVTQPAMQPVMQPVQPVMQPAPLQTYFAPVNQPNYDFDSQGPQPVQPVQPVQPIQPVQPVQQAPVQVAQPVQPVAPAAPAKAPRGSKPKALTKEDYDRLIYHAAFNIPLQTGENARDWYKATYKCGVKQMQFFDNSVDKLRAQYVNSQDGRALDNQAYIQQTAQAASMAQQTATI